MTIFQDALLQQIRFKLAFLYGAEREPGVFSEIQRLIGTAPPPTAPARLQVTPRDSILIAYGDHVRREDEAPLRTLRDVLRHTIGQSISGLHVLPFYPYTSDDGFSVVDYSAVNPELGTWDDVRALGEDYRMMYDAVINHISAESAWFKGYLRGEAPYDDYFIAVDPSTDLSLVTRPRALPLLTPVQTVNGQKYVWTTFSDDQIDLNYANPAVLLDVLRVLLEYVSYGARLIRLDAIAFMWKRIGTTCMHLPETHAIIQIMRHVLDLTQPNAILITETNVPHYENLSYFGDGQNEAQMVYQFSLPPLVLHTFATGDASVLTRWAATIARVSDRTTFFNFLSSHDGIGVRPAVGLLTDAQIAALVQRTTEHGGRVSYRNLPDGGQSPYELNITYFDAITHPDITAAQPETAVDRFICSQAIMLAMIGVPGIYFHSLFGSRNFSAGVEQTGRNRTINREKLDADALLAALADPNSLRARVFARYKAMLDARAANPAFDPLGTQNVLELSPAVFAVERTSRDGAQRVLALHNVTGEPVSLALPRGYSQWYDIAGGASPDMRVTLRPYQVMWLAQQPLG